MTVRNVAGFAALVLRYKIRRRVGNVLVALHVQSTPIRSTQDTLREIVQENLAAAIRKNEQACHTLQVRYFRLGELINESTAQNP